MIIFHQSPSLNGIDKLKFKDWQKSMREITDAEIISINPNPYKEETSSETNLVKVEDNGSNN